MPGLITARQHSVHGPYTYTALRIVNISRRAAFAWAGRHGYPLGQVWRGGRRQHSARSLLVARPAWPAPSPIAKYRRKCACFIAVWRRYRAVWHRVARIDWISVDVGASGRAVLLYRGKPPCAELPLAALVQPLSLISSFT